MRRIFRSFPLLWLVFLCLSSCGVSKPEQSHSVPFVIGGQLLNMDHPGFHNAVGISRANRPICTGALIGPDLVLTAAHCLDQEGDLRVYFGDRFDPERQWESREVIAKGRLKPPRFSPFFDLAWLRFAGEAPEGFRPLPILLNPHELTPGRTVSHVGYGKTGTFCEYDGAISECVGRRYAINTTINAFRSSHRIRHMLITQANEGQGLCMGDSGGPVYIQTREGWQIAATLNGLDYRLNPKAFSKGYIRCEEGNAAFSFVGFDISALEKQTGADLRNGRQTFGADAYQRSLANLEEHTEVWKRYTGPDSAFLEGCLNSEVGGEVWYTYEQILKSQATFSCEEALLRLQKNQSLDLTRSQISDLSPLRHLHFLHTLNISNNTVENLQPLAHLNNLRHLNIAGNQKISHLKNLRGLRDLETLNASSTSVATVLPLCNTPLRYLKLNRLKRSNIDAIISELSRCVPKTLQSLELQANKLKDLSSNIAQLNFLRKLDLSHNRLTQIPQLPSRLEDLTLDHNSGLKSWEALASTPMLTTLTVGSVDGSLANLPRMNSLRHLSAAGEKMQSLEFVANTPFLQTLSLSQLANEESEQPSLEPLRNLPLEKFECEGCLHSNISSLFTIGHLRTLSMKGNRNLTSIKGIGNLQELDSLSLLQAPLFREDSPEIVKENQEELAKLTQLTKLNLSVTGLQDISWIKGLSRLRVFHAAFNAIHDLAPLTALEQLTYAEMSANPVDTLEPLRANKQLKVIRFYFYRNPHQCPIAITQGLCEFYPEMWLHPLPFPQL